MNVLTTSSVNQTAGRQLTMTDNPQPLLERPLIKGALKPPPVRVNPPSYTEQLRLNSEVTIMRQDWQSDPASETLFVQCWLWQNRPGTVFNIPLSDHV